MKLVELEGDRRGEEIVAVLTTEGLEDMLAHLLLRQQSGCRNGKTWSMVQAEGEDEVLEGLYPGEGFPSLL